MRKGLTSLALVGGAMAGLAQAPLDAPFLLVAGLALLLVALSRAQSARHAGFLAFLGGFGYFLTALEWLREPFAFEPALGALSLPAGLLAWAGLAAALALFWGLALWALWRLAPRPSLLALALALSVAEYLRGHLFTGFPWALPAQALIETPLAQALAYLGPYGLTALVFLFAATMASLRPTLRGAFAAVSLSALVLLAWWGGQERAARIPAAAVAGPVVRIVQPAAPQDEKWNPARVPVFFERLVKATAAAPQGGRAPALVVWPETALAPLLSRAGAALERMAQALPEGAELVFGVRRREGARLYNAIVAMGPDGAIEATYDKRRLVPFGEYVPFGEWLGRIGIRGLAASDGAGFSSGSKPGPLPLEIGPAVPLICYEAIFPEEVRRQARRARFILQLTNDAWFGTRSGPYQHLDQLRMRAIESGLPVVRSANTGISALIDPAGRLVASLPLGEAGFLDAPLPPALASTPYGRLGDWPLLVLAALLLGCLLLRSWRERGVDGRAGDR